jgi:hypothetical protein
MLAGSLLEVLISHASCAAAADPAFVLRERVRGLIGTVDRVAAGCASRIGVAETRDARKCTAADFACGG